MMTQQDREIRENCLSEAIRANNVRVDGNAIVALAATFEEYVRDGKKADD